MSREACDSLKARIYKQQLEFSGRLPNGREVEKKAQDIARKADAKAKEAERRGR